MNPKFQSDLVSTDMTITISKNKADQSIAQHVREITGVDLNLCYQCRKCTSGCPVSGMAKCPPSEMMRRLHLDLGDELLDSDILWMCVSCETCSARCPMGIDVAAVMDALRKIALERGAARSEGNVPLFNKAFLKTVEVFGRTYDIAMIAAYKLGSRKLMADTEKFPTMLAKRKIALLPPTGADRKMVRRIFKKTKENKAADK
jgi:heterodisulfide reductase subunit C